MKLCLIALVLTSSTFAWATPQKQSGNAKAHVEQGMALYKKGDLEGAVAEFREAIQLNPDFVEAHYQLGNVLAG